MKGDDNDDDEQERITMIGDDNDNDDGEQARVLSTQDSNDANLAHRYRLSLPSSPTQSSFRVLALLFYEEVEKKDTRTNNFSTSHLPPWVKQQVGARTFIVGTNDEPGYMGGAICAERAAMVQLRFVPSFRLTKLVIATDCETVPISPGMLCREFLAGHKASVPWDLPVISTGSQCLRCQRKDDAIFNSESDTTTTTINIEKSICIDGNVEHLLPTLMTTLAVLYPFPSPYTRLTASQSVSLGEKYNESQNRDRDLDNLNVTAKRLLELAILEAKRSLSDDDEDNHPIYFGAAVVFEDQSIVTSRQRSALEYGCTLDAVSQLAPYLQDESYAPVLIVQADQYGIAHSPFAPARAYLSEHGYEDCHVLVHDTSSSSDDDDATQLDKWELKEVLVADLAPTPPAWTQTASHATSRKDNENNFTDKEEKNNESNSYL